MHKVYSAGLVIVIGMFNVSPATARSFEADVTPLVQGSCVICHGDQTVTPLNFQRLGFDLADPATLRQWERVFERVERGEMPPLGLPRPDSAMVETALASLKAEKAEGNS